VSAEKAAVLASRIDLGEEEIISSASVILWPCNEKGALQIYIIIIIPWAILPQFYLFCYNFIYFCYNFVYITTFPPFFSTFLALLLFFTLLYYSTPFFLILL
jgi:hypothetical protein